MPFGQSLLASGTIGILAGADSPATVFAVQTALDVMSDMPLATVSFRENWGDAWTENANVFVATCRKTVGADVGQATLHYEYGRVLRDGEDVFTQRNPLSVNGWWVKIEFTPQTGQKELDADPVDPVIWIGVVTHDQRDRMGAPAGTLSGNQTLSCAAFEWLLSRVQVRDSRLFGGSGSTVINRGLAFNGGADSAQNRGFQDQGKNRSENKDGLGYYVFDDNSTRAWPWSAADMVEYLFGHVAIFLDPLLDSDIVVIELTSQLQQTLGWYFPRNIETHGRTVYEILNQIIHPQFGVSWSIEYYEDDAIVFVVHSYAATDITLPDSRTFPANTQLIYVDLDEDNAMESVEIHDVSAKYSQVRAEGGLRGSVWTISTRDGTIGAKWNATQQAAYLAGAGDLSGAGLSLDMQISVHDNYRATDKMRDVFTTFRIPTNWDGKVSPEPGIVSLGTELVVFPTLDSSGDPTTTASTLSIESVRFAAQLPLRQGIDYSTSVENQAVPTGTVASAGYVRPFAVWLVDAADVRWAYADKMSHLSYTNALEVSGPNGTRRAGIGFDAQLEVLDHEPGVRLEPTGLSHLIAADVWDASTTRKPSWWSAVLDYSDACVTVYATQDEHVEAVYPSTPGDMIANQEAVLLIRFGDIAKLDYVVAGTILGVDVDGTVIRAAAGGFVVDDRELLRNAARLMWTWHQTDRVSLRVNMKQLSGSFLIGDLITQIGSGDAQTTVNSLVTAIDWDFESGQTTVTTSYTDQLDPLIFV